MKIQVRFERTQRFNAVVEVESQEKLDELVRSGQLDQCLPACSRWEEDRRFRTHELIEQITPRKFVIQEQTGPVHLFEQTEHWFGVPCPEYSGGQASSHLIEEVTCKWCLRNNAESVQR